MKRILIVLSLVLVSIVLLSACAAAAPPPSERVFNINAIEIKGGTSKDKLAPPTINPETLGKTYSYKAPGVADKNDPARWEVGAYQFNPSAMTVWQGDRVKFVLFVVNGDVHKDHVIDPNGVDVVKETEHNRGKLYEIIFTADKVGMYKLHCMEHKENMTAVITVLPR
ncbi:MAG: hypothetical protein HYX92_00675 [Chloroflexi bacterium]|nr:hypothetical protein [Chloroflexota bacterium]